MAEIHVMYFLEDRAQERFIRALVEKIASAESIPLASLRHDVRSARGGSQVVREFKDFASDWEGANQPLPDIVIVGVDGNCRGHGAKVRELLNHLGDTNPLRDRLAFAVPDPHIERWYLLDPRAFKEGTGATETPALPPRKCKKAYYKGLLASALSAGGVPSLLGGPEFAERIVENMADLDTLARQRQNAGLARFLEDLRRLLRPPR